MSDEPLIDADEVDVAPCLICSEPTLVIADGLPMCELCAMREYERGNG